MVHGASLLMDLYGHKKPNGYAIVFVMGTGLTAYGGYDDVPPTDLDRNLGQSSGTTGVPMSHPKVLPFFS
ncbi:hypothetical protein [Pelagicoccus sp. SDUM812002]|uniref:hypothetical protein n=1 Tax=Pelagicoccus sp. SDUM812002 TaxID=3041266 RepID=UPI0028116D6B|nr:hypothetical protein [Pelagicoccus sp. SDUM812002]